MDSGYRLGEWTVRPRRDCIERGEEAVHLKPKAMAVLECLAGNAGHVVTRDELFEAVWPGAVVSDAVLTQCVLELRQALGDSARHPEYIQTIPKSGFRLLKQPEPLAGPPSEPGRTGSDDAEVLAAANATRHGGRIRVYVLAAAFLLLAAAFTGLNRDAPPVTRPPADGETPLLAVLPFQDLSAGEELTWLADGLSAELMARLSELTGLEVLGRTSFYRSDLDEAALQALAAEHGVHYFLEGSVHRTGEWTSITAKLVDAHSGFTLWSEAFERPLEELFEVREEICESVVTALSVKLQVGYPGRLIGSTDDVHAFRLLNQAWEQFDESTPKSHVRAIELARRAVEADPDYARGWWFLSVLYNLAPIYIDPQGQVDWHELALQALEEARRVEPAMPLILSSAAYLLTQTHRWEDVEALIRETGQSPSEMDWELALSYAGFLLHVGRVSEAVPILERLRLLRPTQIMPFAHDLACAYLFQGDAQRALELLEQAWNALDPAGALLTQAGLLAALAAGDGEVIERWLQRVAEVGPLPEAEGFVEAMTEHAGDRLAAQAWLRQRFRQTEKSDYLVSLWAAYLGDERLALDAMLRNPNTWALWNPLLSPVRDEADFKEVVRQLGLEDYWRAFTWSDYCRSVSPVDFECR